MGFLGDKVRALTEQVEMYDALASVMKMAEEADRLEAFKNAAVERERDSLRTISRINREVMGLKRDVENLVKERDLYLRKLDEIRAFIDASGGDVDVTALDKIVGHKTAPLETWEK